MADCQTDCNPDCKNDRNIEYKVDCALALQTLEEERNRAASNLALQEEKYSNALKNLEARRQTYLV